MTNKVTTKRYTSNYGHLATAGKQHRLLLNIFALAVIFLIAFGIVSAALLTGQL